MNSKFITVDNNLIEDPKLLIYDIDNTDESHSQLTNPSPFILVQ